MEALLRQCIEVDGMSFAAAALRIGRGVSRSAARCKAGRMGLQQDKAVGRFNRGQAVRLRRSGEGFRLPGYGAQKKPTAPPHPFVAQVDPVAEPRHMSLVELEADCCHWPYGDGPYTFCGHEKHPAAPYCKAHMALSKGVPVVRERKKLAPDAYVPVHRVPA